MPALLAAALASRPAVHVDADAAAAPSGESLRTWLVVRLLEEGYTVTPTADAAGIDLEVDHLDHGWRVRAVGASTREFTVDAGDPAIEQLEILHRAVDALDEVEPHASTTQPQRYALQVADPVDAATRDRLEPRLAEAVLDRGHALAGIDQPYDRVLCVDPNDAGLAFELTDDRATCGATPTVTIGLDLTTLDLAAAAELLATLEAANEVEQKSEPEPEPEPVATRVSRIDLPPPRGSGTRPPPSDRHPKVAVRLGARAGLVARIRPVDANVGVSLHIGRRTGPAARLDAQAWPSRPIHRSLGGGTTLRIVEVIPAAGFGWRFGPWSRVAVDLGALAGLQVHHYQLQSSILSDSGSRFDWSLEGRCGIAIRLVADLELDLMLGVGRSGRSRTHFLGTDQVWDRGAWRVAATVGFAYTWGGR